MIARSSDLALCTETSLSRRAFLTLAGAGVLAAGALVAIRPAFADALDDARSAGTVGERYDGYAVARDPSAGGLVDSINQQRQAFYEKKAAEQGVGVGEIQAIYAQAIREEARPGWWFQTRSGWQQK